jgi:hypothetical protein
MPTKTRKKKRSTRYDIHNNGARPFFVEVEGNTVTIWKNMNTTIKKDGEYIEVKKPEKKIKTLTAKEIFLGKKSKTGLTPSPKGNTILLKLSDTRYIWIGSIVAEFDVMKGDHIVDYFSDIGNSDVPYPYAVGENNVYLVTENVAVDKSVFDFKKDLYAQWYGFLPGKVPKEEIEKYGKKLKMKTISK